MTALDGKRECNKDRNSPDSLIPSKSSLRLCPFASLRELLIATLAICTSVIGGICL